MGLSTDYPNVVEWKAEDTGYRTGEMVRYQNNIFIASYWAGKEPGVDPGWALYDELYDQTSRASTQPAKIIGYLPTWRTSEGFDYGNAAMYRSITHGIIAFLKFDDNVLGELDQSSAKEVAALVPRILAPAHQAGTTISVALGGATDYGFLHFLSAVGTNADDARMAGAVRNVVAFVQQNDLDGVDLDLECWWDPNGDASKDQGGRAKSQGPHPAGSALAIFAERLKAALPGKLISATLFGTSWYGNNYDAKLADHVDWLSIMSYDFTGSWDNSPAGPHTALYKIRKPEAYAPVQQGSWPPIIPPPKDGSQPMRDNPILSLEDAVWYWSNPFYMDWLGAGQKIARDKITAGVPLYAYDFAYKKDPDKDSGQTPPGYKQIRYKDLLRDYPTAHTAANATIEIAGQTPRPPFVKAPGTYPYANAIFFETPATATDKLAFVKRIGAQGVIIWELSNDVWEEGKSIVKALYAQSGNPATRPALAAPPSTVTPIIPLGVFAQKLITGSASDSDPPVYTNSTPFGTSGPPAVAVYDGKLFCVHEGSGRDGWLWYCTFDDQGWSHDVKLNFGTTGPPAVAVYDDKLFCVHRSAHDDVWMWYCTFDRTTKTWSEDTKLNVGIGSRRRNNPSAALAVYDDKLFCVHEGGNADGSLWYCTIDRTSKTWSKDTRLEYGTSGAPGLAVLNNTLIGFHEGSTETGSLLHFIFDGAKWSQDAGFSPGPVTSPVDDRGLIGSAPPIINVTGSPSLQVVDGKLFCLHEGRGADGYMWTLNDNSKHEDVKWNVRLSGPPAVTVYMSEMHIFHEGASENGRLMMATTAAAPPLPTENPQKGHFNLTMMDGRPGTPYAALTNYNIGLTGRDTTSPVALSRHHIIPLNQLRALWNRLLDTGAITNSAGPLFAIMTELMVDHISTGINIHPQDRADVIQLLEDIRRGDVVHNSTAPHPNGFDLLQEVYAGLPGNLFIGPTAREDDPDEEFEVNAGVVVGRSTAFNVYTRANDAITTFIRTNNTVDAQTAIGLLSNVIRGRNEPFPVNAGNWITVADGAAPTYRLRIPLDGAPDVPPPHDPHHHTEL